MGDRRSYNEKGHAHELTFSTYQRVPVFDEPELCEIFLSCLDRVRRELDWEVWAYVLMPDHVHLLTYPRRADYRVDQFLRYLKQPASMRMLSWMRRSHHPSLQRLVNPTTGKHRLWQDGGGYDRNITGHPAILACIEYIHANPFAKGLIRDTSTYRWSSHAAYEGMADVPFAIDQFMLGGPKS